MGARQSKRSVDITTASVEDSGVAEGAGKLGKLDDAAAIVAPASPKRNGDANHHEEISEKEKQLASDTPENEKDISTEKEIILTSAASPTTPAAMENGHDESQPEDCVTSTPETKETAADLNDSKAEPDEEKKKKDKAKKKWSFRSISFSKKDKQKPVKKQEENGECDKVPEEAGDDASVPSPLSMEKGADAEKVTTLEDVEKTVTPAVTPVTPTPMVAEEAPSVEAAPPVEAVPVPVAAEPVKPQEEVTVEKVETVKAPEPVPVKKAETIEVAEVQAEAPAIKFPEVETCVESATPVKDDAKEVTKEVCDVAPPLPTSLPPNPVLVFAESTMAPEPLEQVSPPDVDVCSIPVATSITPEILCEIEVSSVKESLPCKSTVNETEPVVQNTVSPKLAQDVVTVSSVEILVLTNEPSAIVDDPINSVVQTTESPSKIVEDILQAQKIETSSEKLTSQPSAAPPSPSETSGGSLLEQDNIEVSPPVAVETGSLCESLTSPLPEAQADPASLLVPTLLTSPSDLVQEELSLPPCPVIDSPSDGKVSSMTDLEYNYALITPPGELADCSVMDFITPDKDEPCAPLPQIPANVESAVLETSVPEITSPPLPEIASHAHPEVPVPETTVVAAVSSEELPLQLPAPPPEPIPEPVYASFGSPDQGIGAGECVSESLLETSTGAPEPTVERLSIPETSIDAPVQSTIKSVDIEEDTKDNFPQLPSLDTSVKVVDQ